MNYFWRLPFFLGLLLVSSCGSNSKDETGSVSLSTTVPSAPESAGCLDTDSLTCIIGAWGEDSNSSILKVEVVDEVIHTSEQVNGTWKEISRQNLGILTKSLMEDFETQTLYVEIALADVTSDGINELLIRLGPDEIYTAVESHDLAVFQWDNATKSWSRLSFPTPKFKEWVYYGENVENRLVRWGYVKNGKVYEEVGYTENNGHIDDKSFVYEWNGTAFLQVGVEINSAACVSVLGEPTDFCG